MATALIYKRIMELKKESISGLEKKLELSNGAIKLAIDRNSVVKQATIDKLSKLYPDVDFKKLEIDMLTEQSADQNGDTGTAQESIVQYGSIEKESIAALARSNEIQARANERQAIANERQAIANEETAKALNRLIDRLPSNLETEEVKPLSQIDEELQIERLAVEALEMTVFEALEQKGLFSADALRAEYSRNVAALRASQVHDDMMRTQSKKGTASNSLNA